MDDETINREVLYGSNGTPIPIEETPEIPMDMPEEPQSQIPPPPPMPAVTHTSVILPVLILIVLVVAGIVYFPYIKPFISGLSLNKPVTISVTTTPAGQSPLGGAPTPADPFAGWKTLTVAGNSYKLPPDVSAPGCDVTGCISQGTMLPGGTRLTVSPKTVTQSLSSLRGAVVTDVLGTAFTSHEATVSGRTAIEYAGTFSGRTSGGYGFSEMHGFMIEVTPTLTLEINHFTPTGVTADWASDDALFTQIISTLSFTSELPVTTETPVPATSSGD